MSNRRPSSSQSNAATALALAGLVVLGLSLLTLVAFVLPFVRGIIVIAMLFIIPAAFHYLVWGWWLSQMRDEESEPDEEQRDSIEE